MEQPSYEKNRLILGMVLVGTAVCVAVGTTMYKLSRPRPTPRGDDVGQIKIKPFDADEFYENNKSLLCMRDIKFEATKMKNLAKLLTLLKAFAPCHMMISVKFSPYVIADFS